MKILAAMILSYKKAVPFIFHFLMTIFVTFVTLYAIDLPGRVYNLNHRRPQFVDLNGLKTEAGIKSYRPLQSDITTALTFAASATRAAAACWAAKLLWRYAFMLMEKGEITIAGFSKVGDGGIMTLLWPRDVANRKNVFLAYLILFICFGMDYFSSILTGSVTWQLSSIMVEGSVPLTNIPQGIAGTDISTYRNSSVFGSADAIDGGGAIESVTYAANPYVTRRPIIQWGGLLTIRYLPVGSTLDSVRLPYFRVDKFEYITDPDTTLTSQQKLLLNDTSVYNPYNNDRGFAALLPDTSWGPGSSLKLPGAVNVTESRILSMQVLFADLSHPICNASASGLSIPPHVNLYLTLTLNSTYYSCFAFANVTYTAGAAICQDCVVVAPAVVEANLYGANLQPVPDPLTIEALAITPAVASYFYLIKSYTVSFLSASPTDVEVSDIQSYAIEYVSQAYQSAWSYLVVELGDLGPENQTNVVFSIPASHATIFRTRVYIWAGLHLGVLLCGIAFAYWQSHYRHPWFSNPAIIAFQLDTAGIFKEGRVANPKDPWDPTAEYPAGRLQLQDYDHERPGQPRAVTLLQEDSDKLETDQFLGDVSEK